MYRHACSIEQLNKTILSYLLAFPFPNTYMSASSIVEHINVQNSCRLQCPETNALLVCLLVQDTPPTKRGATRKQKPKSRVSITTPTESIIIIIIIQHVSEIPSQPHIRLLGGPVRSRVIIPRRVIRHGCFVHIPTITAAAAGELVVQTHLRVSEPLRDVVACADRGKQVDDEGEDVECED